MTEFRWILLGLGLVVIAGIWWWGSRRAGQAHARADLRSPPAAEPSMPGHPKPAADEAVDAPGTRPFGVPPFEPLNIQTGYETPAEHAPMTADASEVTLDDELATATAPGPLASEPLQVAGAAIRVERRFLPRKPLQSDRARTDDSGRFSQVAEPARNTSELQKIVAIRACAVEPARWPGRRLMSVLELQGLAFGRYQVYHRKHVDGRTLFCVASLTEPGTFDPATMPDEEFRGVTLFAVLPGPAEPLQTLDALIRTARSLAESLAGTLQDADGVPLSAQRAAALREEVARFQALL
jgi:cell division protein ZipA